MLIRRSLFSLSSSTLLATHPEPKCECERSDSGRDNAGWSRCLKLCRCVIESSYHLLKWSEQTKKLGVKNAHAESLSAPVVVNRFHVRYSKDIPQHCSTSITISKNKQVAHSCSQSYPHVLHCFWGRVHEMCVQSMTLHFTGSIVLSLRSLTKIC